MSQIVREIELEEDSYEFESRIKNLMWTVSEDYDAQELASSSIGATKNISMYNAIRHGALNMFFDKDEVVLYIAKKAYLGGDERHLVGIAQVCAEAACYDRITKIRPGVKDIRSAAFEDLLDYEYSELNANLIGRIRLTLISYYLTGELKGQANLVSAATRILEGKNAETTYDLLKIIDKIYNGWFDRSFERNKGGLDKVLAVKVKDLADYDWSDFVKDELYQDILEDVLKNIAVSLASENNEKPPQKAKKSVVYIDEKITSQLYSYVELNYGKSYLSKEELSRRNRALCTGMHADCSLYYTDGILNNYVTMNYKYKYAEMNASKNKLMYYDNHRLVKANIAQLTDILKKALVQRQDSDFVNSDKGTIVPNRLWRVGRCSTDKLFVADNKRDNCDFVIDILIDGSGSQARRQGKVAMQGYIISEALSNLNIPHRVMSFCSFWDYTILQRFRDYDDVTSKNFRMFEYTGNSNNRDGLAIRAACYDLLQRNEDNKVLIVLSDGRPNDANINRPNSKVDVIYTGDEAVKDTAYEIRKARQSGIAVLGVFAGEEEDLQAEMKMFGKDFAYIRNIKNFSNVVGRYLKKQIND
ncbi:MAG: nitric oxide reductase activation protein [Anaerofustis stercorihominis]|nr:nitric oxide reductase activation protein [Anaerofustis stercorihominis]